MTPGELHRQIADLRDRFNAIPVAVFDHPETALLCKQLEALALSIRECVSFQVRPTRDRRVHREAEQVAERLLGAMAKRVEQLEQLAGPPS